VNILKRGALTALLLLSFTVAASLNAQATTETFTFQMNWIDTSTSGILTTFGSFQLDAATLQLIDYNITVPAGFGTVTPSNSSATFYVNGGPCLATNPCFALTVKEPTTANVVPYNKLMLAFAGDLNILHGGQIVPLTSGAIGRADCDDPCNLVLTNQPVPEPSTMLLLTTGVLGVAFRLRRAVGARGCGSQIST
jgi:hypothetical protein